MIKNYCRSEYTAPQWVALIDKAQDYARECESHEGTPHAVRCNF